MLCDPVGSSMGTDYVERVDCPDCIQLVERADLVAYIRARVGLKDPRRVGKIAGDCPNMRPRADGLVSGCSCSGACLRPMTLEELRAAVGSL